MRIFRFLQIMVIILGVGIGSASAAAPVWVSSDQIQAKLIGFGDEIALQVRLGKGWHTYWRMPGDSGLPARFDWSASGNIENIEFDWPAPKRFEEMELQTFGYADEVIFPGRVVFKQDGKPAQVRLKLHMMVCSDICIPQTLDLELNLGGQDDPAAQRQIEFARRKVPVEGDTPRLKIETLIVGPDALVISAYSKKGFDRADAFVIIDDEWALTTLPEITVDIRDSHKALIRLPKPSDIDDFNAYISGKSLNVTLVKGANAVEKTVQF